MEKETETEAFKRVQTARHAERPYSMDLFSIVFDDFVEIHGDRRYADDAALVCGFARLEELKSPLSGSKRGVTRIKGEFAISGCQSRRDTGRLCV
jgi:acetyl-CoA carboxylase carboxyl transferase subunit alpha